MSDHETDEPEEATCPYCRSTSWCKHQLMHLDETFGEVEDYGVYEEAQELLVKCVVALLKSGKELPESLGDKTLGKFIPLDPDDRPEPTEEAVRDWLADESYYFSSSLGRLRVVHLVVGRHAGTAPFVVAASQLW